MIDLQLVAAVEIVKAAEEFAITIGRPVTFSAEEHSRAGDHLFHRAGAARAEKEQSQMNFDPWPFYFSTLPAAPALAAIAGAAAALIVWIAIRLWTTRHT